jgi:acyl-phosphate glycerol 3-phosphate acyltransferase
VLGHFRGIDIRSAGSGNPDAANALRTQGRTFALAVFLIDTAKGWLATGYLAQLPRLATADLAGRTWVAVLCGLAVLIGHIYPLWCGFRGGKGVATLIGVVLGLDPLLLAPMLLVWLALVAVTGFVGLASMVAALSLALKESWMTTTPLALSHSQRPRAPGISPMREQWSGASSAMVSILRCAPLRAHAAVGLPMDAVFQCHSGSDRTRQARHGCGFLAQGSRSASVTTWRDR